MSEEQLTRLEMLIAQRASQGLDGAMQSVLDAARSQAVLQSRLLLFDGQGIPADSLLELACLAFLRQAEAEPYLSNRQRIVSVISNRISQRVIALADSGERYL